MNKVKHFEYLEDWEQDLYHALERKWEENPEQFKVSDGLAIARLEVTAGRRHWEQS